MEETKNEIVNEAANAPVQKTAPYKAKVVKDLRHDIRATDSTLMTVFKGIKWVLIDNFAYFAGVLLIITGLLTLSTSLNALGGDISVIGLTAFIQLNIFSIMLVMFGLTWVFISQSQTIVTDDIEAIGKELSKKIEIALK